MAYVICKISILLCTFNSELKLLLQNYSIYFVKNIFVLYQQFKRMYETEMHIFLFAKSLTSCFLLLIYLFIETGSHVPWSDLKHMALSSWTSCPCSKCWDFRCVSFSQDTTYTYPLNVATVSPEWSVNICMLVDG